MATQLRTMTADELLAMPDDGVRRELVAGELREMTPAGHDHGEIGMRLAWRLAQHVETSRLGVVYLAETGFKLATDPDTVRAADVAFVTRERREQVSGQVGFWPGAPDLAVEVVSPRDSFDDVQSKVLEWLDAGTRMVIVVNRATRTITVSRSRSETTVLSEDDVLDGGGVVPGWTLPVRDVFA